ncbi:MULTISPECIES: hypothetical protein [Ensifer]|uniref:Phage ABA sandwich domain-containing protein n=1 Tax=Ensifer adhaerens TaxID=106592 RepID=A0ABY8HMB6_ENSAD|nr:MULTISPECIES: hypothetical protein [Ensifer]ANK75786.1 hypothetical protein FA04_24285 [Ensifer adhaerens]KDP72257.1 hypothetical protein FA04_18740 [Ensifer adhaerens]KQZ48008.1 hypothetical protein ASD63_31500 [Ensifer sp. Root558]WFP92936.1 hypothetical protein P4B07_24590 [Ensifer adhaerens]SFH04867.1 hypothetical protein SAMN05216459_114162 [Ensifer sp. OV372]
MNIDQLIAKLEQAEQAERVFDAAIGSILGWRQKVEYVKTDPNGEPAKKVFWVVPSGENPGIVPPFTTSIDAAVELMEAVAPNDRWGVSTIGGTGTAFVGTGAYCHAPTAAMALCIASLKAKSNLDNQVKS